MMLYEKYRPKRFSDVIGQGAIAEILKKQVATDKIAHSYLFEGNRGSGKTTTARILARAINCTDRHNGEPCNKCNNCNGDNNMDITELDAASNNGVDNIRSIIEDTKYAPQNGKYKVYIIDEAHMLSQSAFNAFLKVLEEPPKYVVFILCTTEARKLPVTIISRCQKFTFNRIKVKDIVTRLVSINITEKSNIEGKALELIAKSADGAMRDALSIMEQIISSGKRSYKDVVSILGITSNEINFSIIYCLMRQNSKKAIEYFYSVLESGKDLNNFMKDLMNCLRSVMLLKAGADKSIIAMSDEDIAMAEKIASDIDFEELISMLDVLQDSLSKFDMTSQRALIIEMAIIKITKLNNENLSSKDVKEAGPANEEVQQDIINPKKIADEIVDYLMEKNDKILFKVAKALKQSAVFINEDITEITILNENKADIDLMYNFNNQTHFFSNTFSKEYNKKINIDIR